MKIESAQTQFRIMKALDIFYRVVSASTALICMFLLITIVCAFQGHWSVTSLLVPPLLYIGVQLLVSISDESNFMIEFRYKDKTKNE